MQDSTTRLIRFAIGLSLIGVSALGSAVAHSQAEEETRRDRRDDG
jgi:hypothetical protein